MPFTCQECFSQCSILSHPTDASSLIYNRPTLYCLPKEIPEKWLVNQVNLGNSATSQVTRNNAVSNRYIFFVSIPTAVTICLLWIVSLETWTPQLNSFLIILDCVLVKYGGPERNKLKSTQCKRQILVCSYWSQRTTTKVVGRHMGQKASFLLSWFSILPCSQTLYISVFAILSTSLPTSNTPCQTSK